MKILSYKTNNFAGIKNMSVEFSDGINLLLGPNEAGKSTIIDGIYHTIFTPSKLRMSHKADQNFVNKYFSHNSDTIDGRVEIETGKGRVIVEKAWHRSSEVYERLVLEDGSVLSDPKNISQELKRIFSFGRATYKYLNFASHGDRLDALYNLTSSDLVQADISAYLNKAYMELDGVSLERLEDNISKSMDELGGRWDFERNIPQNNRGIDNKYKVGLGKILEAYYGKEELARDIEEGLRKEEDFEKISKDLASCKKSLEELKSKKSSFDKLAEDVRKRSIKEKDLEEIKKEEEELKLAMAKMPAYETDLERLSEEVERRAKEIQVLKSRLAYIEKRARRKELEDTLQKLGSLEEKMKEVNSSLEELKDISHADLEEVERLEKENEIKRIQISAAKMTWDMKVLDKDQKISLKDALGRDLEQGQGSSYFDLRVDGILNFKVRLMDVDFEGIIKGIEENEKRIKAIFDQKNLKGKKDLEDKLKAKTALIENKKEFDKQKEIILGKSTGQDLKEEFESLKDYTEDYSKDQTEKALGQLGEELKDLEKRKIESSLKYRGIKEKYESLDKVFSLVGELSLKKKELKLGLEGLATLPEGFTSYDDFFAQKTKLDRDYEDISSKYFKLKDAHSRAMLDLPEKTVEEMREEEKDYKDNFKAYLNKYHELEKIKRAMDQTKEDMKSNPNKALENSLRKYLDRSTRGSLKLESYDDKLDVRGKTGKLSYIHLSKGSKDALALSLRLALIDNLFPEASFLALDDILNDLDMERREEVAQILKDFAKENQIIYASFNPDLVEILDAKEIRIEKY